MENLKDLVEAFEYSPELWNYLYYYQDGYLFRKVRTAPRVRLDELAGTLRKDGYRQLKILGKWFMEHRVIYEMHFGKIAEGLQIDHINRDRADNLLSNLRVVSSYDNVANSGMLCTNTSGLKGAHFSKVANKWQAQIGDGKRRVHLGYYDTAEAAHEAYQEAYFAKHGVAYES